MMRYASTSSIDIKDGMTLGESLSISDRGFFGISLPEENALTPHNLRQLAAHHAKFILIAEKDSSTESQVEIEITLTTRSAYEVFSGIDNADPCTVALFEQVIALRSA